ncbi:MAG: hypothetical protein JW881_16550 [Spirochaetales bacterium]|nr:hypothetical protein [Spirochaetales bacterium]
MAEREEYQRKSSPVRRLCRIVIFLGVFFRLCCCTSFSYAGEREGWTVGFGIGVGGALLVYEDPSENDTSILKPYISLPIEVKLGYGINNMLNIGLLCVIAPTDIDAITEGYEWFFSLDEWMALAWPLFPFLIIAGSQIFSGVEAVWYLEPSAPSWFISGGIGMYLFVTKELYDAGYAKVPGVGGAGARMGIGYEFESHFSWLFTCTTLVVPHPNSPPGYAVSCGISISATVY